MNQFLSIDLKVGIDENVENWNSTLAEYVKIKD